MRYNKLNQRRNYSSLYDRKHDIIRNAFVAGQQNTDRREFLPASYLESAEKRAEVLRAIDTLPEVYQECLFLFFYEGMSYQETADALWSTPQNIRHNLFLAKQMLRERLNVTTDEGNAGDIYSESETPVLTQIFREDAAAKIPQELCDKVLQQTINRLSE